MQSLIYYIYLFVEKKTDKVIYVGSTRHIGGRINDHRRGQRDKTREQPIHEYLNKNNLTLIKDVAITIVDMTDTRESALKLESKYFEKYKSTIVNIWKAEKMSGEYSPIRQPLKKKGTDIYYESQRDAGRKLGVSRYQIQKMIERGELVKIKFANSYINRETGETFINLEHLKRRYNIDSKTLIRLSKSGKIVLNGMVIEKV